MSHSHAACHRPELGELTSRLRQRSRRITGPRESILRVLQQHPHPLTNKEIHGLLASGECDLATVYRSLHLLEDMGLVARFDFGDGVARFEVVRGDARSPRSARIASKLAQGSDRITRSSAVGT